MPNYNPLYNMSQLSPYDASFYNKDMLWNASQNRPNIQHPGRATNTPPTNGSNLGSGKDFSEFFNNAGAAKTKKPFKFGKNPIGESLFSQLSYAKHGIGTKEGYRGMNPIGDAANDAIHADPANNLTQWYKGP